MFRLAFQWHWFFALMNSALLVSEDAYRMMKHHQWLFPHQDDNADKIIKWYCFTVSNHYNEKQEHSLISNLEKQTDQSLTFFCIYYDIKVSINMMQYNYYYYWFIAKFWIGIETVESGVQVHCLCSLAMKSIILGALHNWTAGRLRTAEWWKNVP